MAEMPMPQGAPAPAQAPQGEPGGASKLVVGIQEQMDQLYSLLDKSQAISPQDKQAFQGIMSAYQQFVEQTLGSAPGEEKSKPEESEVKGAAQMETAGKQAMPML